MKITQQREKECKHQFQFSHQSIEARGESAVYMAVWYVICPKCGELREQTRIPKIKPRNR